MEITRQILWNIPEWYRVVMYSLMILSFIAFGYGIYRRLKVVYGKNKITFPTDHLLIRTKALFKDWFLQGRLAKNMHRWVWHAFLFFGFFALWIVTDIVALEEWTPGKFFEGTFYQVVSLVADVAGVMLLVGSGYLLLRRMTRPNYLTPHWSWVLAHVFLIKFVVMGFLIEGIRVSLELPDFERWAPVGYMMGAWIKGMMIPEESLAFVHRVLWFWHMVFTMVFIAAIPYTRLSHIFIAGFNIYAKRMYPKGAAQRMNFDAENAEYFGPKLVKDFSLKQRLDYDTCLECGICQNACPAYASGTALNPKAVMQKLKYAMHSVNGEEMNAHEIVKPEELWPCTTCGACVELCPVEINQLETIMDMRRYQVMSEGNMPKQSAADAVKNIQIKGNPWGISKEDRWKHLGGKHNLKYLNESSEEVDYLYFVGCAGNYDPGGQNISSAVVSLFEKANVNFGVMSKESCNGEIVRRLGDEFSFQEIASANVEEFKKLKYKAIVTNCPHCLQILKNEYPQFGLDKPVVHHTELLGQLVSDGKIKPTIENKDDLTFHDPCYLGRHNGVYDAPRKILESIPGVQLKEMELKKEKSFCCGMGGANMWFEHNQGKPTVDTRLTHIAETKAKTLAASCPFCSINFNLGSKNKGMDLKIKDVAELLNDATPVVK